VNSSELDLYASLETLNLSRNKIANLFSGNYRQLSFVILTWSICL
jgi:hypothetical protein